VLRSASLFIKIITVFLFILLHYLQVQAQEEGLEGWEILSPQPGEAVLGSLTIHAHLRAEGVEKVEISFAYSADPTSTWFLIGELSGAPMGHKLVDWETSRLTDGNYSLRFTAILEDGTRLIAAVPGLRVRNYTPVETPTSTSSATPAPAATLSQPAAVTSAPTAAPTLTPIPHTATPLPPNPAILTGRDLGEYIAYGVLGAGIFFGVLGLYASARRYFRR
jgi:hypothetical protein